MLKILICAFVSMFFLMAVIPAIVRMILMFIKFTDKSQQSKRDVVVVGLGAIGWCVCVGVMMYLFYFVPSHETIKAQLFVGAVFCSLFVAFYRHVPR